MFSVPRLNLPDSLSNSAANVIDLSFKSNGAVGLFLRTSKTLIASNYVPIPTAYLILPSSPSPASVTP